MKYIRTKDGRIIENEAYLRDGRHRRHCRCANTIKELCDEFVMDKEIVTNDYNFEDLQAIGCIYNVYGAIWTTGEHGEPILKSVAKINDKGELELL